MRAWARQLELVARYEHYTPDFGNPDASLSRFTGGVNFYFFRPHAKVMLNYRQELGPVANPLLQVQLQVMF